MKKMSVTVPGKTVNELIQYWASTPDSDTPAFVGVSESGEECSISRKEVLEYAGRFAYKLMQLGVKKGSIVCSTLPNSIERVICDMGIYLTGATSMNGQIFHSDGHGFLNSLRATESEYIIVNPDSEKGPHKILTDVGVKVVEGCVKSTCLPHLRHIIFCQRNPQRQGQDFISSLQNPKLKQLCTNVEPSDIATIMTSSGSTGYSKLIQLTHANLCHFTIQVKAIYPLKGGDRFINCAPLGWAGGFPQWYLGSGMTRYFIDLYNGPPKNLPKTLWEIIVKEKIIYGFVSPQYVSEILHNHSWWSNSEWKPDILCLAGQPVKKAQLDIIGKLCNAVDINYGMTECNLVTTHRITDPGSFKDCCAGYPGQEVSLKVVDEQRNELPCGTMGEILLRSPALTPGYLNNDEANKRAFTPDGWLYTDDVGYIDSEGRVFVEGRQSDSILRGTYILYPGWLEQEIKSNPNSQQRKMSALNLNRILVPSPNQQGQCPAWIFGNVKNASSAIVVIQEWWGINDHIKRTTQQIGEETQYVTLVPDLYRGKVATDREAAGHLHANLDWNGAIEDIDACAKYLKSEGIKKVGVTGFCMGGALAIGIAALKSCMDAAVPFYGILGKELLPYDEKDIQIPLQCHFGEKDIVVGLSSPADYEALRKRLQQVKARFEFYVYDAGHAFANPTAQMYDAEARKLSFSRMYKFFAEHLS